MRYFIPAFLLFVPAAFSQTTSVTANMNGTASVTLNTVNQTGTVSASGSGSLTPFGASSVSLAASLKSNPGTLAGSATFSIPLFGSYTVNFSVPYSGATTVNIAATVASGTGIFANSSGTASLVYIYTKTTSTATGSSGTFTLSGTVTLSGISPLTNTPAFAVPQPPNGTGPEGDPAILNCTSCGEPVTLSNGNMFHRFTDLVRASRGFPIVLTRTYNSEAGVTGSYGNGWTNSFQRWLALNGSSVVYYNETGGAYTFTAQNGGFVSPPGLAAATLMIGSSGSYEIVTSHGGVMNFDFAGRLTSLTDANGNTQTVTYTPQNAIASVTDAVGGSLTFSYGAGNRVTSVADDAGRTVSYQYDSSGNLTASIDPNGAQTSYSYSSSSGLLQTIIFPAGGTLSFTYDSNNRLVQEVDRGGAVTNYTYAAPGSQAALQDELGGNTAFQFNSLGNTTQKTYPDGSSITQTFDANARLTSETDGNGATTSYQYDAAGNLLKRTDPLGGATQFTYTKFNKVASVKDPNGNTTQYQYDTNGNLVKTTDAAGGQTTFTYDPFGEPLTATTANGASAAFTYDGHGNIATVQNAGGNSTQYAYDSLNRVTQVTDPLGGKTQSQYDALGRLTQSTNPLGQTYAFSYDSAGNLIRSTDANGVTTNFGYDHLPNLTQVTDALGGVTGYAYSPGACSCAAAGTLNSVQNAAGQTLGFTYNSRLFVTSGTDSAQITTQYAYDATGNLVQTTGPGGGVTKVSYDALGRVILRTYSDGNTASFTYDANGNMLTAKNANVTLTYTYDSLNRLTSVSDSRFPASIVYTYDAVGRRASMTDPYKGRATYSYTATGDIATLVSPNGTTTSFTYDAASRRTGITMGNGISGKYTYNAAGQLTALAYSTSSNPTVAQFGYTFDKNGNRLTSTTSAGTTTYQYDALYRLTAVSSPNLPSESYTYDAVGNRIASSDQSPAGFSGATAFTYGNNGLAGATLPDSSTVSYLYDALGHRIQKTVAGVVTRYLYDGNNILLEQDDSGAAFRARYTYLPQTGEPFVMERSGSSYYYVLDGAGNTAQLRDSTGSLVQSYAMDSFGVQTTTGTTVPSGGAIPNPYIYGGGYYDSETGFYNFHSRYYDPIEGRFITKDGQSVLSLLAAGRTGSAGARQTLGGNLASPLNLNLYIYSLDNPVNRSGPSAFQADTSPLTAAAVLAPESCTNATSGASALLSLTGKVDSSGTGPVPLINSTRLGLDAQSGSDLTGGFGGAN